MVAVRAALPLLLAAGRPGQQDEEDEDRALAAAALADPRAFGPLYSRYAGPIYRYCLVRLRDPEAARDVADEVFLKALRGLAGYRGGRFRAWLYRIARHEVLNAVQRRRPALPLEAVVAVSDPALAPEDAAVTREELDALRTALAALPEEQRAAVELGLAGWSGEEISAALGKSADAVKMLRYRALARLRELLAPVDDASAKEVPHGHAR